MAWSWGAGTSGQLGQGAARDEPLPTPIPRLRASASGRELPRCSALAGGGAHALAVLGERAL